MSWAKLDDRFHEHRKVRIAWRASPAAIGLHVMAITYCAGHETDGLVDRAFVEEKLTAVRERDKAVTALVDAGLWLPADGGWQIHDYLDFNPSRAHLDEKRAKDAERKSRGRGTQSAARPRGQDADSARNPQGVRAVSSGPDPTRPVPDPYDNSPAVTNAGERAGAPGQGTGSLSDLAEQIRGVLQRGVDGLTSKERAKPPARQTILDALVAHSPSPEDAMAVAVDVRSVAQSQNRAPNIAALYEQRLAARARDAA